MKTDTKTLLKAIHNKCLDCSLSLTEVKECPSKQCALWNYRMLYKQLDDKGLDKAIRSLKNNE